MGKQGLINSIFMCFLATLLVACGSLSSPATTIEQCAPSDATPNVYRVAPEGWIHGIYNHVAAADPALKETMYWEARHAAFQILGNQTQRWSDFVDLELPDLGNVRLTITYLSPQLIETILLNQLLINREINYSDSLFTDKIAYGLAKVALRDEPLFLLTITSTRYGGGISNNNATTLDIPLDTLTLTNSSNVTVLTKHDDHSLDQYIRLIQGPFSGLIAYQMTVKNGENCSLLLDPTVNTSISIHLPGLKVDDVDREQQTWTIRYESLLGGVGPGETPNYIISNPPPNFNDWIASKDAPTPLSLPNTDSSYWEGYWQMMGRYIWEQVMFASSP